MSEIKENQTLDRVRKFILYGYLIVPLFSATVSAVHLEKFLRLGNPMYLSISVAAIYEVANLATMFIFILLPLINRSFVWISFLILILMQIVGNIYFSFEWISIGIEQNSKYVQYWFDMTKIFVEEFDKNISVFILSCIIGVPVPILALLLTKSVSKYLGKDDAVVTTEITNPVVEEQKADAPEQKEIIEAVQQKEKKDIVAKENIMVAPDINHENLSKEVIDKVKEKGISKAKDGLIVKS